MLASVCHFSFFPRVEPVSFFDQPSILDLNEKSLTFLDATTHLYKRWCPSVGPSVGPYVPRYFRKTNMADFEEKKSSNDIKNIGTISVDEVVASYVPPRYLLLLLLLLLFLWALFLWQLLLLALWQLWKT